MNAIKKFSAGAWVTCAVVILSLASLIAYLVNVSAAGYFQGANVHNLVLMVAAAAVLEAAAVALGWVRMPETVSQLVTGLCQIAAPVLLMACLINLIAARAEGLGFIYFSNADVILEVQTPENLSSATGTIVNMVLLGVAGITGIVSAFFGLKKK